MQKAEIPEVLSKGELLKLPSHEREHYVRQTIRKTMDMNPYGVSVSILKEFLPFDSRTLEKHLSVLTYTNEIYSVKVGPTTLYLPNSKAMHPVTEKTLKISDREYGIYVLQNRLGKFVLIQERKQVREHPKEIGGGILIPVKGFEKFVEHLNKIKGLVGKVQM